MIIQMKFSPLVFVTSLALLLTGFAFSCNSAGETKRDTAQQAFEEDLKKRTFQYFWEVVDTTTWQTDDRYPTRRFTSIAATGFGLTSYIIGIENGYITREQGVERVWNTLHWLSNSVQGPDTSGISGYKGFYYHFLNYDTGTRYKKVELSTIDTGLLMAGILACQSYFDGMGGEEATIRELADDLYRRVEWDWAMNGQRLMSMGWHPEKGFIPSSWDGYNEAMILLILALGSPTHPIPDLSWNAWCETYQWDEFFGYEFVNFSPLFGHQYTHIFIDFRGIHDQYMAGKGLDYFENSRRATLANRAYCINNPYGFAGYSESIWGLTACDGPANETRQINGKRFDFFTYRARGASAIHIVDDGTIAPTAAGGSVPFAPDLCLGTLFSMYNQYGDRLYQEYGFKDAFNATYTFGPKNVHGWFDPDYLGIDQGPILIQLENYQTGIIWDVMKRNPYIIKGLEKAGFSGGWMDPQ